MRACFYCLVLILAITANCEFPRDDSFYRPTENIEEKAPGTILESRKVPDGGVLFGDYLGEPFKLTRNGYCNSSYHLKFRTTDSKGRAIAAITTVITPVNGKVDKIVSLPSGSTATNLDCSSSFMLWTDKVDPNITSKAHVGASDRHIAMLQRGWTVVISDTYGLDVAYGAGIRGAHVLLDAVRATLAHEPIRSDQESKVVLWGTRTTSTVSALAAELQPLYAPEMNLVGVALTSLITNTSDMMYRMNDRFYSGLIMPNLIGISREYPQLKDIFTTFNTSSEDGKEVAAIDQKQCYVNFGSYHNLDILGSLEAGAGVLNKSGVSTILRNLTLGYHVPDAPLLIYNNPDDEFSQLSDVQKTAKKYCDGGAKALQLYALEGPLNSPVAGKRMAMEWLDDRLNGVPLNSNESHCAKTPQTTTINTQSASVTISISTHTASSTSTAGAVDLLNAPHMRFFSTLAMALFSLL